MTYTPIDYASDLKDALRNALEDLKTLTRCERTFVSFQEGREYAEFLGLLLDDVAKLRELVGEADEGTKYTLFRKQGK